MTMKILAGDGYQLTLKSAPPLAVSFLRSRFGNGMTAASAAKVLSAHGYRAPKTVADKMTGRCLGHQSTLVNWGTLEW